MKALTLKTSLPKSGKGFTLLELMVGIGFGVIVLGGILAVYIPTVKSWSTSSSLAQIHDTESLVNDLFGTSIRQAGLLSCGYNIRIVDGIDPDISRSNVNTWAFSDLSGGVTNSDFLRTSFRGFSANSNTLIATSLPTDLQNNRLSHDASSSNIGDIFYTLSPIEGFYRVNSSSIGGGAKSITLSSSRVNTIQIEEGAFYLVNDCANPVVVRADANSSSGVLNYTNNQLNAYPHPTNTVVNRFEPAIFYLGRFTMPDGSSMPTLYKSVISKDASSGFKIIDNPILTGVENLRIEYGVALDSASQKTDYIVKYYTINQMPAAATLNDVHAVRISVMIQAAAGGNQKSLVFPDLDGNPVDCFASATVNADACPDFVTSAEGRKKAHKVIQFSFILPRIISI